MKIVVTTPTGRVGSMLARQLIRGGEKPTLLVRSAARLDQELAEASEVIELDQGDADALAAATRGADAMYWVDPPTEDDDPAAGYARMGRSAAQAVVENGIPRVVFQSSVGADARQGFGEIDGLGATEQSLDDTGASVTHLRCGYFFTNLLMDLDSLRAGNLFTTLPLDQRIAWVDPRDIAEVGAGLLLSTGWSGHRTQGVYGPTDLSFTEVAEILSDATGREIRAGQISDEDVAGPLRGFGMTERQVEGIVGMMRGMRGFEATDPRDQVSSTPSALGGWAYENLRPAL